MVKFLISIVYLNIVIDSYAYSKGLIDAYLKDSQTWLKSLLYLSISPDQTDKFVGSKTSKVFRFGQLFNFLLVKSFPFRST